MVKRILRKSNVALPINSNKTLILPEKIGQHNNYTYIINKQVEAREVDLSVLEKDIYQLIQLRNKKRIMPKKLQDLFKL